MSNWIGEPKRLVVCAANRYGTLIITGVRHFDSIMIAQIRTLCGQNEDSIENRFGICEQGFVDNHGIFMDRKEAFEVAKVAGQLNFHRTKTGYSELARNQLYSEDLY